MNAEQKMDAALKAKWVEALRSGQYKQSRGKFETRGRFCCLGVLCKVAGQPTLLDKISNWQFAESVVPEGFRGTMDLVSMNDSERLTFPQIADYIEENL